MSQAETTNFTVCALFYGDYPALASRCLGSIARSLEGESNVELRLGLNSVSNATRSYIQTTASMLVKNGTSVLIYDAGDVNRLKYPMMRKMFYDAVNPVRTSHLMWFDDDSYITQPDDFWRLVEAGVQDTAVLGQLYTIRIRGHQAAGISRQPWYTGKTVDTQRHIFKFPTGGFWIAKTSVITADDYPFTAITHCGGDVMLGELCRQRNYRMRAFGRGVAVNADDAGRESKAARRGVSVPPVWSELRDSHTALSYHDFTLTGQQPDNRDHAAGRV